MSKTGLWTVLFILCPVLVYSQTIDVISGDTQMGAEHQHAHRQYIQQLWQEVFRHHPPTAAVRSTQKLIWPVRQADTYEFLDIFALSGYVDHDERKPNQVLDYQCGRFTYDNHNSNHQGTDISLWPFAWQQMDRDQAQVIAAAAGEIIEKVDDKYDRNCPGRFVPGESNAVLIRHDDGTTAMYLSLKAGSLTEKTVGQRVVQGEYLGVVGSSGNTLYPHLHFELRSLTGEVIDPFAGPCNPIESYWQDQRPYLESGANLLSTSLNRPDFNNRCDPADYTPQDTFEAGDSLYFLAFARQVKSDQFIRMRVLMPNGNALTDRSRTADLNSSRASFIHAVSLPESATKGSYTCILNYSGQEYRTTFYVQGTTDCPAPDTGDLVAEVFSANEARLTCEGTDTDRFAWQIRRAGTPEWNEIPTEAYSFFLRGLQAETTYEFRVRYWCNDDWSSWSPAAQFTTLANPSCPAVLLTQTTVTFPSLTQATISIDLPGKDRYDWRMQPPDDQWYNVISRTDSSITFDGLIPNTTYQYRVRVRCGNAWSSWSDIGSFTTPHATSCDRPEISDFSATPISSTEALFAARANDKERYDWRLRPPGSDTWITIPSTTAQQLVVRGLEPGINYEIQHRWICTEAWSEWSESLLYESPATPCPTIELSDLSVTFPAEGFADISIASQDERPAYQLRYRLSGSTDWNTLNATSEAIVRIPVRSGEAYSVQVRTFCTDNWSNWSTSLTFNAPVIVVCPPVPLDSTSVDLISPTEVHISVMPPPEVPLLALRFRKNNATTWAEIPPNTSSTFQLTGLSPGTTYSFQVRGTCDEETTSWSNTGFFTTPTRPVCFAPDTTDFTAQVLSESEIQIIVTTDTARHYQWRYRLLGKNTWQITATTASNEWLLNDLVDDQWYTLQMRQECVNGIWSDWSAGIQRRTATAYICTAPPTNELTAFNLQAEQASLLYTGNTGLIFQWRFRESGQNTWTTTSSSPNPSRTLNPLVADTDYEYQLRVDCGQGWSSWSVSNTFSTLPLPPPCATPQTNQINIVLLPTIRAVRVFVEDIDTDLYQWRLRRAGQSAWVQSGESTENSWLTEPLSGETNYELQIRVRCNGSWTIWSILQGFTTPIHETCDGPIIDQITIRNISDQEAVVEVVGAQALRFSVQFRVTGSASWSTLETQSDSEFLLSGLHPETGYEVRFRYECETGWSTWSPAASFTTAVATNECPDPTVANITVVDTGAREVLLHISGLDASEFQIQYQAADATTWEATLLRTDTLIPINHLKPETAYHYRFRYECPAGWSAWSPIGTFTSSKLILGPCSAPSTPIGGAGLSHLRLRWQISAPGATYEVRLRDIYAPEWQIYSDISDTTLAIPGLEPCTAYEWQVRTVCDTSRSSAWSPLKEVSTTGCSAAYCYSYGLGRAAYIDAVTINEVQHESGNNYGYADHTYKEFRMPSDAPLAVSVRGAFPAPLQVDKFYWRIWLDRNQDGDFQDEEEKLLEATTPTGEALTTVITHDLPASAHPYRLRIGLSTERYPQGCAVESNKYVEDYQVFIDLAQNPIRVPAASERPRIEGITPNQVAPTTEAALRFGQPFPNPFTDLVTIPIDVQHSGRMTWHLYSAQGLLIQSQTQFVPKGPQALSLSGQQLSPGYYTLLLQMSDQRKMLRLVKMR